MEQAFSWPANTCMAPFRSIYRIFDTAVFDIVLQIKRHDVIPVGSVASESNDGCSSINTLVAGDGILSMVRLMVSQVAPVSCEGVLEESCRDFVCLPRGSDVLTLM